MAGIIYTFANTAFTLYGYAIFIYILLSWFPNARENRFGLLLHRLIEPYFAIFRRFIPSIGMIDISSLVAILFYHYILVRFCLIGLAQLLSMFG